MTDHLVATLIDVVDVSSWRAVAPHAKKGWKPPKHTPITRPGTGKPKKKRKATSADLASLFGSGLYVGRDN